MTIRQLPSDSHQGTIIGALGPLQQCWMAATTRQSNQAADDGHAQGLDEQQGKRLRPAGADRLECAELVQAI